MNALGQSRRSLARLGLPALMLIAAFALGGPWAGLRAQEEFRPPGAQKPAKPRAEQPRPTFDDAVREVFFSDVRAHLGPESAAPVEPTPMRGAPTTEPPVVEGEPAAPASGTRAWSQLISRDALEDEIKAQGPLIAEAVASPSKFKSGGYRQARASYSLLAVLFGVIGQYDGDVRWKAEGAAMRDALARAGHNCKVGTEASLKEAKARNEDLAELIRGGAPALEAAATVPEEGWASVADRAPLMARLEAAQRGRLDVWTADAAEFKRQRDALLREARVLLLLSVVIQDPSYEFADDAQYQEYAKELEKRAGELIEALQQGDYSAAQSAVSRTNQTCDRCHTDFRG